MILSDTRPTTLVRVLPGPFREPAEIIIDHLQHGTFQRSMCLLVASSSIVTGMEVGYEHYKGSYSNPVMYTPVILSGALTLASIGGFFSGTLANSLLRYTSLLTLIDGLIGFGFHIRGVARKPGGWRLPVTNIVMGPPLFAPLLFGTSAYLGVIASFLQREEDHGTRSRSVEASLHFRRPSFGDDIRTGRIQKHLCVVCAIGSLAVGAESWYSHYKDGFEYRVQWSPVLLAPLMIYAALTSLRSKRAANTLLPAVSALLIMDGVIGTAYHMRGIARRSGGTRKPLYNILYGPPIFAPMLMAACGLIGALAYFMRRERD